MESEGSLPCFKRLPLNQLINLLSIVHIYTPCLFKNYFCIINLYVGFLIDASHQVWVDFVMHYSLVPYMVCMYVCIPHPIFFGIVILFFLLY